MTTRIADERHEFLAPFAETAERLARSGPAWLDERRRAARAAFERAGLPTVADEAWRTTNVSAIAATVFRPADGAPAPDGPTALDGAPDLGGPRLVLIDGRVDRSLSDLAGLAPEVEIGSLADALVRDDGSLRAAFETAEPATDGFRALHEALWEGGALLRVADGAALDRPLHVVHRTSAGDAATASFPRTLVRIGRGARATVVESFVSPDGAAHLRVPLTTLEIGDDADLAYHRLQLEGNGVFHVAAGESRQGAGSRYAAFHLDVGGRLARNDLRAVMAGERGVCRLDGLYLTSGRQHVENHTLLDHASPQCDSRESFKGILGGRSRTVFNGRILVRPGAQRTDAKQSNRNLLLSPEALAQTRPQLEIRADDVKCTHGATIGRLDEQAMFYLRSRAIPASAARDLLVRAFAGEVLDGVRTPTLRAFLDRVLDHRLAAL